MSLEQIWELKLRVIWTIQKFNEVMLSKSTPGPSSRSTRPLSSSSFHIAHPYTNVGQIIAVYGWCIVATEFSQLAAPFIEELSPIPTLKTTCGNSGRRKNIARADKCRRSDFYEEGCQ
ncbi:hypothetical protein TNCV_395031 [Trichonephila clavipes]|nr:hypothetical protein TNCV_395031 [Trichonephila clavipes]